MTIKTNNKPVLTTIGIDQPTNKVIDKLCKRYSLKKGEIVKLAFTYIDKACINPAEAPESVKAELAKINKRQNDIISFIKKYEEDKLNPMIRTSHSIAERFDNIVKELTKKLDEEINNSKDILKQILMKLDEKFKKQTDAINNQSDSVNNLNQTHQQETKKFLRLISLCIELAACGVMDSKRKENLKAEINDLINKS